MYRNARKKRDEKMELQEYFRSKEYADDFSWGMGIAFTISIIVLAIKAFINIMPPSEKWLGFFGSVVFLTIVITLIIPAFGGISRRLYGKYFGDEKCVKTVQKHGKHTGKREQIARKKRDDYD